MKTKHRYNYWRIEKKEDSRKVGCVDVLEEVAMMAVMEEEAWVGGGLGSQRSPPLHLTPPA